MLQLSTVIKHKKRIVLMVTSWCVLLAFALTAITLQPVSCLNAQASNTATSDSESSSDFNPDIQARAFLTALAATNLSDFAMALEPVCWVNDVGKRPPIDMTRRLVAKHRELVAISQERHSPRVPQDLSLSQVCQSVLDGVSFVASAVAQDFSESMQELMDNNDRN